MCDPVTMTFAAVQAAGSISQGIGAKRAANSQAAQYELQAATERDNAQAEADKIRRDGEVARGQTLSALAASGVTVGQGSALDAERQVVDSYTSDEYMAILTGDRRARGLQDTARQTRRAGRDAMRAGFINAGTSLLASGARGMRAGGQTTGSVRASLSNTGIGSSGFGTGLAYGNQDMGRYF